MASDKRPYMIVHHSASPRATTTPEMIHEWHIAKGWHYTGYHWIIDRDGRRARTDRPLTTAGAHCPGKIDGKSMNVYGWGVCVIGNFEVEKITDAQKAELISLLKDIETYRGGRFIYGHRDAMSTACPGRRLYALLDEIRAAVK